jgi:hypothetical protein
MKIPVIKFIESSAKNSLVSKQSYTSNYSDSEVNHSPKKSDEFNKNEDFSLTGQSSSAISSDSETDSNYTKICSTCSKIDSENQSSKVSSQNEENAQKCFVQEASAQSIQKASEN